MECIDNILVKIGLFSISTMIALPVVFPIVNWANHNKIEKNGIPNHVTFQKMDGLYGDTQLDFYVPGNRVQVLTHKGFSLNQSYWESNGDSLVDRVFSNEDSKNINQHYKSTIERFGPLIKKEISQEQLSNKYPFVYKILNNLK